MKCVWRCGECVKKMCTHIHFSFRAVRPMSVRLQFALRYSLDFGFRMQLHRTVFLI